MSPPPTDVDLQTEQLRQQSYNATVVAVRYVHEDLLIMRVKPDVGMPPFVAGQYATLGLGDWESRVKNAGDEVETLPPPGKLIERAYSVSASMLDDQGHLVRISDCDYLEFYVTLVRHSGRKEPSLTPRLFHLQPGDRLSCRAKLHGHYTLGHIEPQTNVVFAATGTGEAPHNAMLAELLSRNHQGKIVSIVCVRYERDLGYNAIHRELERRYSNYRYLTLTTREPVNVDPNIAGYVGKRYLQDYFASGEFESRAGWSLSPIDAEVYLCGNPAMIGLSKHDSAHAVHSSQATGMVALLQSLGFRLDTPSLRGNIHTETYW